MLLFKVCTMHEQGELNPSELLVIMKVKYNGVVLPFPCCVKLKKESIY